MTNKMNERIFVNFSNHPVSGWSEEQKSAALALGFDKIIDVKGRMPLVPSRATREEVKALAERLWEENKCAGGNFAGEFCLTFALVERARAAGARPFAATTDREVKETIQPDGTVKKEAIFKFVQWREF